ncbi:MAG: Ig-like domain-containing protein [Acidobacteriota bacterium]|nr:Ig-like domain-containing protein [Acidobacteriota bacterium]
MLCTDPMSYLSCNAVRAFQDQFVACGEFQARRCSCGGGSQNSFRELLRKLGPSAPLPPGNATISFINPAQQEVFLQGNREIEITVEVTDPEGVSKVELIWDFTGKALDCAVGGNGVDWSCTHSGNRYTWKLDVGTGDRTYRVRVTDDQRPNGGVTTSPTRTIHLTADPPPVCATPEVRFLDTPAVTRLAAGNSLTVRAFAQDISEVSEIKEVQLVWLEDDGLTRFIPMLRESDDVWKVTVQLPARARAGSRHLCLRATTFTGESKLTEHMHAEVSAGGSGASKKGSAKPRRGQGRKGG